VHLVMFDIDGTLVESYDFDSECYKLAVFDVLGVKVNSDWGQYQHVTDAGILSEIIESQSLQNEYESIFTEVKKHFILRVRKYISNHKVLAIAGASDFLSMLASRGDVKISLATGGWSETARMKLEAAGIKCSDIPIASSCDHYSRIEIMRVAEARSGEHRFKSKTYFGDGSWDKKASKSLNYNFVAVGSRITSSKSIHDYSDSQAVLRCIGL
jgi:phosphoglycolate phosphatase-like HAD superfamily hydrolase